jgi:hypothetical protein
MDVLAFFREIAEPRFFILRDIIIIILLKQQFRQAFPAGLRG